MARTLIVKTGDLAGRRITVDAEMTLGRTGADMTLPDGEISNRHAALRPFGDGLEIEDLGSTNGTWVNGARITETTRLFPGDVVRIGQTTLAFDLPAPMTSPAPVGAVATPGDPSGRAPAAAGVGSPPGAISTGGPPGEPPAVYGSATPGPLPAVGTARDPRHRRPRWPWIAAGVVLLAAAGAALYLLVLKDDPVTRAEFIGQADDICRAGEDDLEDIQARSQQAQTPEEVGGLIREAVEINRRDIEAIKDLEQPEDGADELDQIYDKGDEALATGAEAAGALEAGDQETFRVLLAEQQALTTELSALMSDFGFEVCGPNV